MTYRPRLGILLLLSLSLTFPLFAAQKRRAVGSVPLVNIHGTVTDEATGNAVAFAEVSNGDRTATADAQGKYQLQVSSGRPTVVVASRSGYEPKSVNVNASEGQTLDVSIKSKSNVQVKMADGTSYTLDFDVTQFAYAVPFSDYGKSDFANLCKSGTPEYRPLKTEIKRITGPFVLADTDCCTNTKALKGTLELKSGGTSEVFFKDTCFGYDVLIVGRDHTTGLFRYLSWSKIQEVVFP